MEDQEARKGEDKVWLLVRPSAASKQIVGGDPASRGRGHRGWPHRHGHGHRWMSRAILPPQRDEGLVLRRRGVQLMSCPKEKRA